MTFELELMKALSTAPPLVVLVAIVWMFLRDRALMKGSLNAMNDQVIALHHDSMEIVRENTKAISELREVMARMNCPYLDSGMHAHPEGARR